MDKETQINWFPGHMKVATDAIQNMAKKIDLILEIIDARGICVSSNLELLNLFPNKPIIKLALKNDLADLSVTKDHTIIFANKYQNNLRHLLLNQFEQKMLSKTKKLNSKGLLLPNYNVMVIGLPNVGKSTIINVLSKKTKVKTENRPGVTKSISVIKLNSMFNLIDTPGILFKKIDKFITGAKLTLMGIIKEHVVPIADILIWAFDYLKTFYPKLLINYLDNFTTSCTFEDFIYDLAKKRNFITNKNELDFNKALITLFNNIVNGTIGKINYEKD
ncbi:ribosome biogenesis GTPase YlqF [Mycoplasmoides alvi]|uniref:ribosome biogenesis GTPase YlqF n=1 Tax=Mycoplasmoides alvi TaxID=78580 RepID=UPI00051AE2AC|nr:ribosome biogenesis GTPase YlqF [Mycoplasmoides alvi]